MPYPLTEADRVAYWVNQVTYARTRVKPLFDACDVLAKQYYNEASTEREQDASEGGATAEEHIRRTKSNIIFGWIDQSISNMFERSPSFQCLPETQEAAQRLNPADSTSPTLAAGTAKIANYRYRETNQLRVDERVGLDAFIWPYGVAKLGYTVDFDEVEQDLLQEGVDEELPSPEDENALLRRGIPVKVTEFQDHTFHIEVHKELLKQSQPKAVKQNIKRHNQLHRTFRDRKAPSVNTNVRFSAPFAVRWPPDMFLTDSLCMDGLTDARWIAFGWQLPLDEVQADRAYKNTELLTPTRLEDAPARESESDYDGFDLVRGWEIWARNFPVGGGVFKNLFLTIAEGAETFLRYEEEWPYDRIEDYPAEILTYQTGVHRWFHKPPLLMGGGDTVQSLVNEILDSYLSIVRRQKNIWLVDPITGITEDVLQDILAAPDCGMVSVPGLIEAQGKGVIPLPFQQVPEEKGALLAVLQQMFDRSVGTPQPQRAIAVDTATEASINEKRNTARENRRSSLLSEFQIRKARKMWQLDTQFQPKRLFLLDANAPTFIAITPEMAMGEYMFTVDIAPRMTALAVERSQWMDLINLLAGLTPVMIQAFGAPPNLPELIRRLLVRGFDEKLPDEILPMLNQAKQVPGVIGPAGAAGENGMPPGMPQVEGPAQEAVVQGRTAGQQIGPLIPSMYNRELPNQGRLEGEAQKA